MDIIENKVQQLKELSKKQKKLNEIKHDIADILGNANMDEKKQIAEKMSSMEYENIQQARNLQCIIPHIVKELYEHDGPKGEFVIPKKISEPIVEKPEPIVEEPIIETQEPIIEEPVIEESIIETPEPIIEEPIAEKAPKKKVFSWKKLRQRKKKETTEEETITPEPVIEKPEPVIETPHQDTEYEAYLKNLARGHLSEEEKQAIKAEIEKYKERIKDSEENLIYEKKKTFPNKKTIKIFEDQLDDQRKKITTLDQQLKPFTYYAIARNKNPISKKLLENSKTYLWEDYHRTIESKEPHKIKHGKICFDFDIYGFTKIIKNPKAIKKNGVYDKYSDKTIYKLIGPDGKIIADYIGWWNTIQDIYLKEFAIYEQKIQNEFFGPINWTWEIQKENEITEETPKKNKKEIKEAEKKLKKIQKEKSILQKKLKKET